MTFSDLTDGDTPSITVSIRMLSIDAPEVHYPETTKPSKHDALLAQLGQWLKEGKAPVDDGLAAYLHPKLTTGKAGTLQEQQGDKSSAEIRSQITKRLDKGGGRMRRVFLGAADEHFDQYGRLLAYLAPDFSAAEIGTMARHDISRATFNLTMVQSGWAATFPICPSIPRYDDLVMLYEAGKDACESKRGMWSDAKTLTGYEFRMCQRLAVLTQNSPPASR